MPFSWGKCDEAKLVALTRSRDQGDDKGRRRPVGGVWEIQRAMAVLVMLLATVSLLEYDGRRLPGR